MFSGQRNSEWHSRARRPVTLTRVKTRSIVIALTSAGLVAGALTSLGAAQAAGTWSTPIVISPAGQDGTSPRVTSSTDGRNLVSAWTAQSGLDSRAVAAFSTDHGASWSDGTTINPPGSAASSLQLAGSQDGRRQHAVWRDFDTADSSTRIRVASFNLDNKDVLPARGWSDPVLISDPAIRAQDPDVATSADGRRVTVAFHQGTGADDRVLVRTSDDFGATFSPAVTVAASGADTSSIHVVSSSDGSRLAAVWEDRTAVSVIRASSSRDFGTSWTVPQSLSRADQDSFNPDVFITSDGGRMVAVWQRSVSGTERLIEESASTGGAWDAAEVLSTPGQSSINPDITGAANGSTSTVVWANETLRQVQASHATGTTWSGPVNVSEAGSQVFQPAVAASVDGSRVSAVWQRAGTSRQIISNDSSDAGATWNTDVAVSAASTTVGNPDLAAASNGFRFAATYSRSDGSNNRVEASSFLEAQPQSIDFAQPAALVLAGGAKTLTATATSGLPVSFATSTPGVCTVAGDQVTPVGVGSCAIVARQSGNQEFQPAPEVTRIVTITGGPAARKPQRLQCAQTPPRKLKRQGTVTVLPRGCRTTAGQKVSVTVTGKRKDLRNIQVVKRGGKTAIRTFGKRVRVTVTYRAPATSGFAKFKKARTYRT